VVNKKFNYDRLSDVVKVAVRMLDNVIDVTKFPVERVQSVFSKNRRIGLGIMGLADMFFEMGIGYNTKEARKLASKIMKNIRNFSYATSEQLAKEKGNFENHDKSIFCNKFGYDRDIRNVALTTCAPTGSISTLANVSGGIEPYFLLAYKKINVLDNNEMIFVNQYLMSELKKLNLYKKDIIDKIVETGSIRNIKEIPIEMKKIFLTAMDISPLDHISMQADIQKYCDNAISKTINLPYESTVDEISDVFLRMYLTKCKGGTVYRNKSREVQVLNSIGPSSPKLILKDDKLQQSEKEDDQNQNQKKKRKIYNQSEKEEDKKEEKEDNHSDNPMVRESCKNGNCFI